MDEATLRRRGIEGYTRRSRENDRRLDSKDHGKIRRSKTLKLCARKRFEGERWKGDRATFFATENFS